MTDAEIAASDITDFWHAISPKGMTVDVQFFIEGSRRIRHVRVQLADNATFTVSGAS
jgi:hypothetical protein